MEPVTQFDACLVAGNVKQAMRDAKATSRDLWSVEVSALRILTDFNVRIHDAAWETHIRALANSMKVEGFYQDKPMAGYVAKEGDEQVIYVTDGHCRYNAVHLANSEGAEIERVPVVVSAEPLLGPVELDNIEFEPGNFINALDLEEWRGLEDSPEVQASPGKGALISWVVVGGESGPKARPMHPDWARSLRDQCAVAGVPFLFKQWGEWVPHGPISGGDEARDLRNGIVQYMIGDGREFDGHFRRGDAAVRRVGKKAAGRLLDGVKHDGYPGSEK